VEILLTNVTRHLSRRFYYVWAEEEAIGYPYAVSQDLREALSSITVVRLSAHPKALFFR